MKGEACFKLQFYEEALLSFAISYVLDPSSDSTKRKIISVSHSVVFLLFKEAAWN